VTIKDCAIGVIGLGQMGSGIAANLAKAGFAVTGHDLQRERVERLVEVGGQAAASHEALVEHCDVVLSVVEGHVAIHLSDMLFLPKARPGQIVIDHSTVPAPETRRIGQAFIAKGARYLDAPISGGKVGAAAGTLRIFVGGDKATADECWPLFEAMGNPDKIVYCGPIGMGQVAKVVQQLTLRLPNLARLEVMMFGLRAGLDESLLFRALDVDPDSNDPYAVLYRAIKTGTIDQISPLVPEWPYYFAECEVQGFHMPILEGLYEVLKDAPKTVLDTVFRPEPSVWTELMTRPR
jgi:3-hydroxyisobutyrate dehydrogenase-like beta-hydroxyacid dehydrogenase